MWRARAAVFGFMVLVGLYSGAHWLLIDSQRSNVWFLNALPTTVHITVADKDFRLNEGDRLAFELPKGDHHVHVTRAAGSGTAESLIETTDIKVPGDTDAVIYNVAGAAPLARETVTYTTGGNHDEQEQTTFIGGMRWFVQDHVNYVFRDPPTEVSTKLSRVTHLHIDVIPKANWQTTIAELADDNKKALAIDVATSVALLAPDDVEKLKELALVLGNAHLTDGKGAIGQRLIAAAPKSKASIQFYQDALLVDGKREQLIAEFSRALEAEPNSPDALYWLLRVIPRSARLPRLNDAVQQYPSSRDIASLNFFDLVDAGHPKAALAFLPQLDKFKFSDDEREDIARYQIAALATLGRLRETANLADDAQVPPDIAAEVLKRVAGSPSNILKTIDEPLRSTIAYVYLDGTGAKPPKAYDADDVANSLLMVAAALHDGATATLKAIETTSVDLSALQPHTRGIELAIAVAQAQAAHRDRALAVIDTVEMVVPRAIVIGAVLDGKDDPAIDEARFDERAALRLAIALQAKDAAARKHALAAALRDEPLPGPVHTIAAHWLAK